MMDVSPVFRAWSKCLECHASPQGNSKEEAEFIKLAEKLKKENKNIPWLIYSKQPDHVFFSHAAHIKMAKLECQYLSHLGRWEDG